MRYTTEVVNNIKVIKLNSWRDMFIDKIKSIRTKELFLIRLEIVVDSISGFLAWMISTNLILTTFLVFFLTGHEISLARAYAGIQVFKFLEYPLRWIPEFLSSLLDWAVSLKRIHRFLECSEINPALVNSHDNEIINTDKDIVIESSNFTWGGLKQESEDKKRKKIKRKKRKRRKKRKITKKSLKSVLKNSYY